MTADPIRNACPTCGALPGKPCLSATNNKWGGWHTDREPATEHRAPTTDEIEAMAMMLADELDMDTLESEPELAERFLRHLAETRWQLWQRPLRPVGFVKANGAGHTVFRQAGHPHNDPTGWTPVYEVP